MTKKAAINGESDNANNGHANGSNSNGVGVSSGSSVLGKRSQPDNGFDENGEGEKRVRT